MNREPQWSLSFRYLFGILFFGAGLAFLFYAHEAVRNLVVAAFVAYLINPAVVYLSTQTKMSRTAAVNVVYFSALILLVGLPATLAPIFYDEMQIVIQDLLDLSNQMRQILSSPIDVFGLTFHLEEWGQSIFQIQDAFLTPVPEQALELLETTSVGILWFLVILVSVHLFLAQWPNMRDSFIAFAPPEFRPELRELYKRVRRIWMAYLRGQIVLMIIVGVVFTIAWTVLGIPGALVLGVVAGLFTLVPDVGPFLAAALAVGVALLEGSTWIPVSNFWVAIIVFAVYLVLISLKNFLLRPIIMGRSVHMNEALVFIIIVVATILEGILGALLVVPLVASAVLIASYIQRRVLGLTPFEDDGSQRFVMPEDKIKPRERKWGRRKTDSVDDIPVPEPIPAEDAHASSPPTMPAPVTESNPPSKPNPARKKTQK
jgi:predicted PurR-regulated permease PerM